MTDQITIDGKTLDQIHDEAFDDMVQDAKIDRWHDGYFMAVKGKPRPDDADAAAGWDQRAAEAGVQVVEMVRPEGYYHAALGAFD